MAMYTTTQGWINTIESRTSKNGSEYFIAEICIQSKQKDNNGEYTIYEKPCFIHARVFSENVINKLLTYDIRLLVQLDLKLESDKKDNSYYQNWILLDLKMVDSVMATELKNNCDNDPKEIAEKRQMVREAIEEIRAISFEQNNKEHPIVC